MFKPRSAAATAQPPSVELVRQRAKHRLMGVSVLVLAAVVLFPLLFDTQPRPIPVDIPIEIPSRKTAKPLTVELAPEAAAEHPTRAISPAGEPKPLVKAEPSGQGVVDDEVVLSHTPARPVPPAPVAIAVAPAKPAPTKPDLAKLETSKAAPAPIKDTPKEPVKEASKDSSKPVVAKDIIKEPAKEPVKEPVKNADAARAQALLEGKTPPTGNKPAVPVDADAAGARYIVQVGAFADSAVAQAARLKLERAGLKTYTHETLTPEGKRIRVRLGPFATRAEAEKAAAKAKSTGTAAAILTL